MSVGKWCFSYNEENFEGDFESMEDAIEEVLYYFENEYEEYQDCIWVGQTCDVSIGISADMIIDQIQEDVYEQVGDYAEEFLSRVKEEHKNELENELHSVFMMWMVRNKYRPSFYRVNNVQKINLDTYLKNGGDN
ncbi:hypothetical protein LCM23_06410 [Cytobacillus kochii]|uniref:hypothetical protein n=1 Tax=Cytobacillus kochii TaxID=859143 RepID=UPI001CD27ED2|nr:hypothetical protein [Cytobacillus kochii]MCA1025718.1 hypothetical protein [Cytobacillus kochii]